MRKLWLVLVVSVLAVSAFGAEVAQARLDPSFGSNGVIAVRSSLPAPWSSSFVRQMAAASDGGSYVLLSRYSCPGEQNCTTFYGLYRYTSEGVLDPTFGGPSGFYEVPLEQGPGNELVLAADSQGRPLLMRASEERVVVRRLTWSGVPDPDFGTGGVVTLECTCDWQSQLVPGPGGTLTVAMRTRLTPQSPLPLTLIRLRADGSPDPRFGERGTAVLLAPHSELFATRATTPGGALYLTGHTCCGSRPSFYLARVSAKGRFDERFARTTRRSLHSLKFPDESRMVVEAVVVRPQGKLDLLGHDADYKKGFQLRVKADGRIHRRFGRDGLRVLPKPVTSATLGSDGATLALSGEGQQTRFLMRVLAGGRLDPEFDPAPIPDSSWDWGMSIVSQVGRKALVLDLGLHECRSLCSLTPKLIRFIEGPR